MKFDKKKLLAPLALVLAAIWAFIMMERGIEVFNWLDLLIFFLLIVFGVTSVIQAFRKKE